MYNYTADKSLKHPVILPRLQCPFHCPCDPKSTTKLRWRNCLLPAWKLWSSPHFDTVQIKYAGEQSSVIKLHV